MYPFKVFGGAWAHCLLKATNKGDAIVGNDVWIGNSATIMAGVTIGDGTIIGANSLVTKNVPLCTIVVGNPAR